MPEPNSGCLIWLGACDRLGYGLIKSDGRWRRATHAAMTLAGQHVPPGMCVLHRCDNAICVNFNHLFIGNRQDNVADMVAKGRRWLVHKRRRAHRKSMPGKPDLQNKVQIRLRLPPPKNPI